MMRNNYEVRVHEKSFTLVETLLALGIMAFLILEVGSVQGNAIYINDFGRKSDQAAWLAKRVMSQVEYQWTLRQFSDLSTANEKERPFEDDPDFLYSVDIQDWKFPILDLLANGMGGGGKDDSGDEGSGAAGGGMGGAIKDAVSQVFGDELLKTAKVEVSWAEGTHRNQVTIAYLLTNQRKVDESLAGLKAVADQLNKTPGGPGQKTDQQKKPGDPATNPTGKGQPQTSPPPSQEN